MAHLSKTLHGFRLPEEGVWAIADLLRPYALAQTEELLANLTEPDESFRASYEEWLRMARESNGLSSMRGGVLRRIVDGASMTTDVPETGELTETFASGLDYTDGYEVYIKGGQWGIRLSAQQDVVTVNLGSTPYSYPTIEPDALDLFQFMAEIVEIVKRYPAPIPERTQSPFRVFIGHGGDTKWRAVDRVLKSEGFQVVAYESEPRVGAGTLDSVQAMIASCNAGVIVMTATDEQPDGSVRARENVIHEMGFCHGRLGLVNTLVMVESPIVVPTNYEGRDQLRFPNGNINEKIDALVVMLRVLETAHVSN